MSLFGAQRAVGLLAYLPVAAGLFLLTGCHGETPTAKPPDKAVSSAGHEDHDDEDHHEHHHHHAEKGPHGGALVAIGEDDAHLEVVLDGESGKLTAWVLDGEAEKPVAIKQASLQLGISLPKKEEGDAEKKDELPEVFPLLLTAVDPQDGKASEFSGAADELKGVEHFEAALTSITVGTKSFKNVPFAYPEGNEDHHD